MSYGVIVLRGSYPQGSCPRGSCPRVVVLSPVWFYRMISLTDERITRLLKRSLTLGTRKLMVRDCCPPHVASSIMKPLTHLKTSSARRKHHGIVISYRPISRIGSQHCRTCNEDNTECNCDQIISKECTA